MRQHRMNRVSEFVTQNLHRRLTTALLADVAGLSVHHFCREFQRHQGMTPQQFVAKQRIAKASERIEAGEPLARVAIAAGFCNQSHMTTAFRRLTGITPSQVRQPE